MKNNQKHQKCALLSTKKTAFFVVFHIKIMINEFVVNKIVHKFKNVIFHGCFYHFLGWYYTILKKYYKLFKITIHQLKQKKKKFS